MFAMFLKITLFIEFTWRKKIEREKRERDIEWMRNKVTILGGGG